MVDRAPDGAQVVSPGQTDFSVWDRETLERFAREIADENATLKTDLKLLLAAWRQSLKENT